MTKLPPRTRTRTRSLPLGIATAIILGSALAGPALLHAEDKPAPKPDAVAQEIFKENGLESRLVKAYDELKDLSPRADGRVFFSFDGLPGLQVFLDRDYWVISLPSTRKGNDVVGYMFNPRDEQSALNVMIGNDGHLRSQGDLEKHPGFSGLTFGEGEVGGVKVQWRRWSEKEHLFSDCTVSLPARDKTDPPIHRVNILITANNKERRSALEEALATLQLQYGK